MNCPNCELRQRHFFCESCLRGHLRDFRAQISLASSQRDAAVSAAVRFLQDASGPRVGAKRELRGSVSEAIRRVEAVEGAYADVKADNDRRRNRIEDLQNALSNRRALLSQSKAFLSSSRPMLNVKPSQSNSKTSQNVTTIQAARSILTRALLSIFTITPPTSSPHWTIAGLILPVPGDIRKMTPEKANASIGLVLWFLSLLSGYLGVVLPFHIVWSSSASPPTPLNLRRSGKFGIGTPWISARSGMGTDEGSWARWSEPHPLYLSSTSSSVPTSPATSPPNNAVSLPDASHMETGPPTLIASFTTGLAMLCYNISYLGHTQSVPIPLASSGDILANLYSICLSPELGRRSHTSRTDALPPPTPPSFPIDFGKLLQATAARPRTKIRNIQRTSSGGTAGGIGVERIEEEEEWEVVEDG